MTTIDILHAIQNLPLAAYLRDANPLLVQVTQVFHVLGLILLLTALIVVNLRLFGFGIRSLSAAQLARATSHMLWLGLALTVASGTLLFLSAAANYYTNPAFGPKILLLVLAVFTQFTLSRKVAAIETPAPWLARTTAAVSLSLWFGVGFAGRAIGYV